MPRIHLLLAALAGFAIGRANAVASNRTCYYPDGTVSPDDMPCSDADTTHCCNSMNACLSTGYCMSAAQQPYVISRGSCTDDAWGTGCPARCAGSSDNPGGGRPISWLGTKNSAGAYLYCCGVVTVDDDGDLACENSASSFTLGSSTILYGAAILANTTNVTASSSSSSSSSAEASAAVCSPETESTSSDSSKTTAVGAGVGVSLGAVAVAALSWALWERRKRTKMLQDFKNGRLPSEMNDGSVTEGSTMSPGHGGYGKVHNSPQPPAELSAYPRQELPAQ
ncbi:hypothetical protein F503_08368 [Ophiostoma piceae UAMH 11346]|uniref:Uncharacterized protein n=1 Tax=Ophiostoma piceae (strain UAMH 11346) TaxID=1262450 RepID=S3BZ87_OPHP1|nr:hypothetical protein F503_08368 [Ophiostoma piceae UAMH 11346]